MQDVYPFVKYEMFAYLKTSPDFKSFIINVVDKNEIETTTSFINASTNLFYPYNRRGLSFTISLLLPSLSSAELLAQFSKVIQLRNQNIKTLKLYSIKCSCDDFKESNLNLDEYIKASCEKKLLAEHHVQ